jgi:hypothetical protein
VSLHRREQSARSDDRVEISPEQLAAASDEAERLSATMGQTTRVIGWYHSHPHLAVVPSHVDVNTQAMYQQLDSAFVGLIFSVFNHGAPFARPTLSARRPPRLTHPPPHALTRRRSAPGKVVPGVPTGTQALAAQQDAPGLMVSMGKASGAGRIQASCAPGAHPPPLPPPPLPPVLTGHVSSFPSY